MSIDQVARIICAGEAKQRVVMLGKAIKSNTGIVPPLYYAKGSLSSQVRRRTIINCHQPLVGGPLTLKRCAIEMIRRRHRQQHSWAKCVYPGKVSKDVLLAFPVTNAGSFQVGMIRYLKEISAGRAHKAKLVCGRSVQDQ